MYIYVDESGNSGTSIVDDAQPNLYSLAISCSRDFDYAAQKAMDHIRRIIKDDEIHAHKVGLSKINSISGHILRIGKDLGVRFHFVAIEKNYVSLVRLFDCIFDPFDNPAVPWTAYNLGVLRNLLLVKFSYLLHEEDAVGFWNNCLMEKRPERSAAAFIEICNAIRPRVNRLPDKRSRDIISEALEWASTNSEDIVHYMDGKRLRLMGAANFVAFTMLVPRVCMHAIERKAKIKLFIHDEQSQFQGIFKEYFKSSKAAKKIDYPSYFGFKPVDFSPLAQCEFSIRNSKFSNGLQFVDVVLYLLKKAHSGEVLYGAASKLTRYAIKKSSFGAYTYRAMIERIQGEYAEVMSRPFSDEDRRAGEALQQRVEEVRQIAMREYAQRKVK